MVAQLTKRLNANATGSPMLDQFTNVGGANKIASVLTDDGLTSYIDSNGTGAKTQGYDIDTTFTEKFGFVNEVRVVCEYRADNDPDTLSNTLHILINATRDRTLGAVPRFTAATTLFATKTEIISRPGGGQWTDDDFRLTGSNRFIFEVHCPSQTPDLFVTELFVDVDYIPLNKIIDLEREIASRRLRAMREPEEIIQIVNGWEALEAELMDPIGFSHSYGPTHDALGWGVGDWERGFGRLRKQTISLGVPKITSSIVNRRRYQTTYWETGKLVVSNDPDIATGMARLDASGADREFSRSSKAWVEDTGGVIRLINEGKEKFEPKGLLVERAKTNFMTQSSFVNGTTGWTKANILGTGTLAVDTSNLLFESAVSPQSVKITITASPPPYQINLDRDTDSLSASTEYTLSVDWEQDNVGTLEVQIKNNTTTDILQDDGSWSSGSNVILLGTAVGSKERDQVVFTTQSTSSAHKIILVVKGSVNGAVHNFFHVQVETEDFASSRIVTEGSSVTRAEDSLLIRNDSSLAQRIWPVDKFTAKIVFSPLFSTPSSDFHTIVTLFHNANNLIRLQQTSSGLDKLRFVHISGSTNRTATFATPGLVAGTEYTATLRLVGSSGELDKTAGRMSIFLDGVKGETEATASADVIPSPTSVMQIGSLASPVSQHADCHIAEIMISPIVFSDTEIAGGLP